MPEPPRDRLRPLSLLLFAAALLLVGRQLPLEGAVLGLRSWLEGAGAWGALAYVALYVLFTVAALPGAPLTLLGGAAFGPALGTALASAGSTLGAAAAFLVARGLGRERLQAWLRRHPRQAALDRALQDGGWRVVLLLRLSPLVPFNLQNYGYGLTGIRFGPCLLASWIGMLPGTAVYVTLGHTAGVLVGGQPRSAGQWATLGVGLLATVVVTVYVTRLAHRRLQEVGVDEADAGAAEDDAQDDVAQASAAQPDAKRTGRGSRVLFAGSLLALAAALGLTLAPGCVTRLFGPPQVELGESYAARPDGPAIDHAGFDALLRRHVDADGWVDYAALQAERAQLQDYLQALAALDLTPLGRDERLALLLNAYNAATLELILDHGVPASIKDIPGAERWDAVRWTVGGQTYSLNQLEHEQVRAHFKEPRIHFALVCAAVSCPPLRNEAYTGARLEQQLAAQAEYVHAHRDWYDPAADLSSVGLTALYDWYGGDFEQVAGSVLAYVARADPRLEGRSPRVTYLDYDWRLNGAVNRRERPAR